MAETHVELNQFPVPRVGPRHSTHASNIKNLQCPDLYGRREICTNSLSVMRGEVYSHGQHKYNAIRNFCTLDGTPGVPTL